MKTKLDMWMQFIGDLSEEGVREAVKNNKEIKKAKEELEYLTGDEEMERLADIRLKAKLAYNTAIANAKEEGRENGAKAGIEEGRKRGMEEGKKEGLEEGRKKGIEEGEKEKQKEIAKKLKDIGLMSIEQIEEVTVLSKIENM